MGELRAYLLPVRALAALLSAGPDRREHVRRLVVAELAPVRPPALGPIFTRVPGTPLVRSGTPTPDDLDRLLDHQPVPPDRARATWRLVEAVAAGSAAARTRTPSGRPAGLAPLGLAVPVPDDLVVGSWTLARAAALPPLATWLAEAHEQVPTGPGTPEVVVFWEARPTG